MGCREIYHCAHNVLFFKQKETHPKEKWQNVNLRLLGMMAMWGTHCFIF